MKIINNRENTGNTSRHYKILVGIGLAIIAGFIIGGIFPGFAVKTSILGEIFLNLLMMIVVPLVMLSIIVGITNLGDIRKIGSIGKRTIIYYFVTTALSVLAGIILVNAIKPGQGIKPGEEHPQMRYMISSENSVLLKDGKLSKTGYNEKYNLVLLDQGLVGNIKSAQDGRIEIASWEKEGKLKPSGKGIAVKLSLSSRIAVKKEMGVLDTIKDVIVGNKSESREGMVPRNIFNAMMRMELLPLIFFSLLLGAALSMTGESGKNAIEIISVLNDSILKIVEWIMVIAPVGIFGIICARIGKAGGFAGFMPELAAVGKYSFTVVLGLALHGFVILPLILYFFGKRNPLRFSNGVAPALLNAFSTASSSATLPLTMETIEHNNKISSRTAGFVLPIGATINMDGTALYEAVAAMFIAQVYGIDMGFMHQVIIFLTATLAAVGAAGIPEAGLVTMVIVLKAVGLPIEGIGLILTVDWLLDRFRTTINVWGDCVGAGIIETFENRTA